MQVTLVLPIPCEELERRRRARDQLGHADAEILIDRHDLAARDQLVIHQQIDRTAGEPIEFDDRAREVDAALAKMLAAL